VVGRHAGKQPSFPYSDALKAASFYWDKQKLDRWLTDPDNVVPGTDMAFRLADKVERDRIIEYLEQLK
jgi:cytochrome c